MRLTYLLAAIGIAASLAAIAPVTAEANSTSPYMRSEKIRNAQLGHHRMHHRMHRQAHHHRM